MKKKFFVLLLFIIAWDVRAVTLVYSMKIRRAFEANTFLKTEKKSFWALTALPILYMRSRRLTPAENVSVCEKARVLGAVFNARYLPPTHWWAEITTALENQRATFYGSESFKASKTGLDDIVITAGKNFFFHNHYGQVVLYGLAGLPTKWDITEREKYDPLIGTRLFTLGFGGELSYSFIKERKRTLTALLQLRFLHSFNRRFFPVLPCNAVLQPGNVTDVCAIMQYREKKNLIELGYNPTFFTNQAVLLPAQTVRNSNFVRNSFYVNLSHLFKESLLLKKPGALTAGFSIARSEAEAFNAKITVIWIGVTLLF